MAQPLTPSPAHGGHRDSVTDEGWAIVQAAAAAAGKVADAEEATAFAMAGDGHLRAVLRGDPDAVLAWRSGGGWELLLAADDPRRPLIDLYLPICSATGQRPITIGHVGQSLDGFIAMPSGESNWITGRQNILHMHRLRALCDAVVVGAGTVAADDPQLTTRLIPGPSPLRVVLDPGRRLPANHRVFTDDGVETLYVCARSLATPGEDRFGRAAILAVDDCRTNGGVGRVGLDMDDLVRRLRARGCRRVFVEGGAVTVSLFLEARLLDRLHITLAAVLIGDGRPTIRFPPAMVLGDCPRPEYRVFRMGGDVLFDCDLRVPAAAPDPHCDDEPSVTRII
jgi:diaminohydroxyphosphoribosylaminopyrimidine deaminase/5-amino-6-(5-phosphoribosylamino)uracil reductase